MKTMQQWDNPGACSANESPAVRVNSEACLGALQMGNATESAAHLSDCQFAPAVKSTTWISTTKKGAAIRSRAFPRDLRYVLQASRIFEVLRRAGLHHREVKGLIRRRLGKRTG
jgi:hypothetical protein